MKSVTIMLGEVFKDRIEELKEDVKKFTALELETEIPKTKIYYGYRASEARKILNDLKKGVMLTNIVGEVLNDKS